MFSNALQVGISRTVDALRIKERRGEIRLGKADRLTQAKDLLVDGSFRGGKRTLPEQEGQ
jgi:hypothetical protein